VHLYTPTKHCSAAADAAFDSPHSSSKLDDDAVLHMQRVASYCVKSVWTLHTHVASGEEPEWVVSNISDVTCELIDDEP
jgi:hypothetical protein